MCEYSAKLKKSVATTLKLYSDSVSIFWIIFIVSKLYEELSSSTIFHSVSDIFLYLIWKSFVFLLFTLETLADMSHFTQLPSSLGDPSWLHLETENELITGALLKTNRYDKMKNMEDKKICPKCGREEKVKNGFNRGKQRYLCKNCGCNYTGTKNGYSEAVKQEAIKYYMEGMGFRRIERLLHVSHVSVINWVKKAAKKIRENECKKETRSDIIELDEMCISFKKTSGYGQQ